MKFISVQEALKKGKGNVALHGWVYRERGSNIRKFIVIRDATDIIQCVLEKGKFSDAQWREIDKLAVESSVAVEGELAKDERAPTGYELRVSKIDIFQIAEKFPITKDQSKEFLMDMRHLWLRSRRMNAILKIRSEVFGAIHGYFRENSYFEYQSPCFTPVQCEGGSTLFSVDYFGKPMYLTQSWQLYAEAGIFSLEKIYTIAPSFRAEKSKTSRHLTEYWHAEMEAAWMHFDELLDAAEGLIRHIVSRVLKERKAELAILERDIKKLEKVIDSRPFPRITYDEALQRLQKKGVKISWGKDLRTIEEEKLVEQEEKPMFVTRYPRIIKAFYMKSDPKNPKVVLGTDLLAPEGYGEIIGGSEREVDPKIIMENLKTQGEDPSSYSWYLDLRKYGSVPHAGFGMGVERIIRWVCGLDTIKDAIPFPRTMERYTP